MSKLTDTTACLSTTSVPLFQQTQTKTMLTVEMQVCLFLYREKEHLSRLMRLWYFPSSVNSFLQTRMRSYPVELEFKNVFEWMNELRVYVLLDNISVISGRWKGDHDRLCAMNHRLGSNKISSPVGFELATPWSDVGSVNYSTTPVFHKYLGWPQNITSTCM